MLATRVLPRNSKLRGPDASVPSTKPHCGDCFCTRARKSKGVGRTHAHGPQKCSRAPPGAKQYQRFMRSTQASPVLKNTSITFNNVSFEYPGGHIVRVGCFPTHREGGMFPHVTLPIGPRLTVFFTPFAQAKPRASTPSRLMCARAPSWACAVVAGRARRPCSDSSGRLRDGGR